MFRDVLQGSASPSSTIIPDGADAHHEDGHPSPASPDAASWTPARQGTNPRVTRPT
jgi:hypothetical protein